MCQMQLINDAILVYAIFQDLKKAEISDFLCVEHVVQG